MEFQRPTFGSVMGLALVTLIALKLARIIDWSWWWVLAPLWIQLAGLSVVGLLFVYLGVTKLVEWWHWRRLERRPDW